MRRTLAIVVLSAFAAPMHVYAQVPPINNTGGSDNDVLKRFVLEEGGQSEKAEGFLAPSGRFRVKVPHQLVQQDEGDPDTITFTGPVSSGAQVLLIFRRVSVTPGASPAQLMLVTRDRFAQKLPGFTVLKQDRVKLANRTCSWMIARYDYQGNRGYPQIIENAFVVDGADGYIIHTEIAEAQYNDATSMLTEIYRSFRMIPPPHDKPVAPPPASPPPTKQKKPR